MHSKPFFLALAVGLLALSGCQSNSRDHFANRRTLTGSNIPTRRDQLPDSPVSATTPPNSLSRQNSSLYPTEPVVGRTGNTAPETRDVNTGAGPAGSNPALPINQGN